MNFFEQLRQRLALPMPAFFKQVAAIGNWLTGIGMLLIMPIVPSELGLDINIPVILPPIVTKIGSYMVVAGFFISRVAKLTVQNPEDIKVN